MEIIIFILILFVPVLLLELLMVIRKRFILIRKLKATCKQEGYELKFLRNRFASVFFGKGKFDLLIEGVKGKYAVSILTSRHRRGMWHFIGDTMVIFKKRTLRVFDGGAYIKRSLSVGTYIRKIRQINLPFSEIACKYPLHRNVCILNPAPSEVAEVIDGRTVNAGDQYVLESGFMLFGLSGFIRYISK
jgi:hypothetical protein